MPLKRAAIQLRVAGPAPRAVELRQLLDATLGGLEGESNWLTSIAPAALAASPYYGAVIFSVTIGGVAAGLMILWLLVRRIGRGAIGVVAVAIYISSYWIDTANARELHGLQGGIRLLGFLGIIMGIVDWIRPRRAKPPAMPRE